MTIVQIGILAAIAALLGRLRRGRGLALLAVSGMAVYALQPPGPFVSLAYWLPTATLGLTALVWAVTSESGSRGWRENWPAAVVLAGVVILADVNRYLGLSQIYMTTTPRLVLALGAVATIAAVCLGMARWDGGRHFTLPAAMVGLILIFVFLKSPLLDRTLELMAGWRGQDSESRKLAFSWLGFSYVAFRLIHTVRDRQTGRLPSVNLQDYVNYVLFFPAFTAGPIDRLERFVRDLHQPAALANEDWIEAGSRLFVGLFKKFVLADLLAVISINDLLVAQTRTAGWLWIFLYAYAFRIYFDFSGYTDIAIGVGRLMGVRLPENFAAPYLKPNLTQFWNAWHMTLTQWFRSYFFNPLTRALRSSKNPLPATAIIFLTQISTMVLIGLWHGIAWGFIVWGLWHGVGLFMHNRWVEFSRSRWPAEVPEVGHPSALGILGTIATFHFVTLGWLFFTLSSPEMALLALRKLFGLA